MPPVAAFTASPTSGELPFKVSFTNRSTGNINGYWWDFESRGRIDSVVPNPSYTYRAAGTYTAKLTVSGAGGTSVATATVQVRPATVGFSQVRVSNCNSEFRSVNVWLHDLTDNVWTDHGALADQHDSSGFCPVGGPKVLVLKNQHLYELVCVDTGNIGCGRNDPTYPPCQRWYQPPFFGKTGGGILPITVG
jgi:hypothetical protein